MAAQAAARTTGARTPSTRTPRARATARATWGRGDGDEGCGKGDIDGWSPSSDSLSSSLYFLLCRCMCGDNTVADDDIDLDGQQEEEPNAFLAYVALRAPWVWDRRRETHSAVLVWRVP